VEIGKERVRVGDLAQVELMRTQLAELQFSNAVIQAQSRLRIAKRPLPDRFCHGQGCVVTGRI
jgi:cytochrome c-type biogenesis protein CcmE